MMERVENVAGEFRKAAHSQMAATTQRTIRENVNISSQLAQLTEKATNLTAENDKLAVRGGALLTQHRATVYYLPGARDDQQDQGVPARGRD